MSARTAASLAGLRVLELGAQIAAPYCTHLLAQLGADVIKAEPPAGDPLRSFGPFPGDQPDPNASGLFRYLNANKRGTVLDPTTRNGVEGTLALAAGADLVVENLGPGTLESFGLGFEALRRAQPEIALVRISSFGQSGPESGRPTTDLVLQAASGWVASYDAVELEPVRVGGRMPEFVSGCFAASAALSAVLAARQRGEASWVDLSMQECLLGTLPYPMVMADAMRSSARPAAPASYAPFGIKRCLDGWVGINILTQAHWVAACRVLGVAEFADSRGEVSTNEADHRAFQDQLQGWLDRHHAEEIVAACQAVRIPAAVVGTGETVVSSPQLHARGFFVQEPGGSFVRPSVPFRLSATPASIALAAPDLEPGAPRPDWLPREGAPLAATASAEPSLPFQGLRILDLGTFWAGPYIGMYFASLGADVIKVESIKRPDGFRFIAPVDAGAERWYEAGALFQSTNMGKRSVSLDLGSEEGRSLLLRLVESSDVLLENYAPRVMERFALVDADIRRARADVIVVRMPAFGLEGPYRDYVGWAMALAQATGISWLTGDPSDELPRNPGSFIDPGIAMHAAVAVQAALAHRRRTGEGQQIEMAQIETTACMCPEPVIDYSLNGRVQMRHGNGPAINDSSRAVPEGVYRCREASWVALSVRDDADWRALVELLGNPEWARDPDLAGLAGRTSAATALDRQLRAFCQTLAGSEVLERLRAGGIPSARLLTPADMYGEPQLEARGYYQTLEHPVTGKRRYPGWPMRFSFLPGDPHPRCVPTLGQHNREILGEELGIPPEGLERLEREGIIGERFRG